jgi:hypothetical protein
MSEIETAAGFQARYHQHMNMRLAEKDRELQRAVRALRLEALKLSDARARLRRVVAVVDSLRESYRGKGASQGHYVAILCKHRVRDAVTNETTSAWAERRA